MRRNKFAWAAAILAAGLFLAGTTALAVDYTYDNGDPGVDLLWSNPLNWTADSGFPSVKGDTARFDTAVSGNSLRPTLDQDITLSGLSYGVQGTYEIKRMEITPGVYTKITFEAADGSDKVVVSSDSGRPGLIEIRPEVILKSNLVIDQDANTNGFRFFQPITESGGSYSLTIATQDYPLNYGNPILNGPEPVPSTFSGGFIMEENSSVSIANTCTRMGTGPITMNQGSAITLGGNMEGGKALVQPITLLGDAMLRKDSKWRRDQWKSVISGDAHLTIEMQGSQGDNMWVSIDDADPENPTPNLYTGGTTLRGKKDGTQDASYFRANKDGAFGTGDILNIGTNDIYSKAHLIITEAGGDEDRIDDGASVYMTSWYDDVNLVTNYPMFRLADDVNETVAALYINGAQQAAGTYGAVGSGADFELVDYFGTAGLLDTDPGYLLYVGTGLLTVPSLFDPADFDHDGNVDIVDVNLLTAAANLAAGMPVGLVEEGAKYDLSGNDFVDGADLDLWLAAAATIDGRSAAYYKGDTNLDADVDVWDFDGSGDAQILSENLGTVADAVWGDGDFNGDGDVDVWDFDGSGDAQQLSENLGKSNLDVGQDAAAGTAEALYNAATGELFFDVGEGIAVIGIGSAVMDPNAVDAGSLFGTPGQKNTRSLAYFNSGGLPIGEDSVGLVLPAGLTADDLFFSYTPIGGDSTAATVTMIVPEPSTIAMLLVVGLIGVFWRRRRA